MSNLVSIITPCLNSEKTIERTILSVLNQSYKNIQYIVIDGKSSDNTLEILKKYQEKDSRLLVVSEKDNSMTEALNRGLYLAKGNIVASINADDWYEMDAIAYVVKLYQNKPFICLIGNTQFISESGKVLYTNRPWTAPWLLAWYIMGCLTTESSVFYSADCIKDVGYFNEKFKYTQDFEYYLRILKKHKITYTNKLISNFWVSANQTSFLVGNQMSSEVLSYIDYKILRKIVGGTSLGSFIRIFLGVRRYTINQIYNHILQYLKIRGYL
ncbi:glycosyltransferase [Anabaena sp. UHCC 0187]|uniref:glycosyltransferase family 2 protein n=1 Tax=Anabaena sp. UHCC 0187 TaxID=2590018 RepID=UPI0014462E61|nr:glycosyltransferase family 2 protein [Anabaena sp. UHCC 0187]MTJ12922.1 glycosyltransferase [Anabaena sp. UHCC 0187]